MLGRKVLVKKEALRHLLLDADDDKIGEIIAIAKDPFHHDFVYLVKMFDKKFGLHRGNHPFLKLTEGNYSEEEDCIWCLSGDGYFSFLS